MFRTVVSIGRRRSEDRPQVNAIPYAITLPMSAKRTKRWVVYECRNGEFVFLSRLFTTRAQAEKERDKLKTSFKSRLASLGVGFVAKE